MKISVIVALFLFASGSVFAEEIRGQPRYPTDQQSGKSDGSLAAENQGVTYVAGVRHSKDYKSSSKTKVKSVDAMTMKP